MRPQGHQISRPAPAASDGGEPAWGSRVGLKRCGCRQRPGPRPSLAGWPPGQPWMGCNYYSFPVLHYLLTEGHQGTQGRTRSTIPTPRNHGHGNGNQNGGNNSPGWRIGKNCQQQGNGRGGEGGGSHGWAATSTAFRGHHFHFCHWAGPAGTAAHQQGPGGPPPPQGPRARRSAAAAHRSDSQATPSPFLSR